MKQYIDNVATAPVDYSNFRTILFHSFMNHSKYLTKFFSMMNVQIGARNHFSCSVIIECFYLHLKLLIHTCPKWGKTCQTVFCEILWPIDSARWWIKMSCNLLMRIIMYHRIDHRSGVGSMTQTFFI